MLVHTISHLVPGLARFLGAMLEFVRFHITNFSEEKYVFFSRPTKGPIVSDIFALHLERK